MRTTARWLLCALLATAGLNGHVRAQGRDVPPPPRAETVGIPADGTNAIQVANTSGEPRDPFLPVGYLPPRRATSGETTGATPVEAFQPTDWEQAQKMLNISGISRAGTGKAGSAQKYMAIINGRLVEEGNNLSVTLNGIAYRWQVQSIGPEGVCLTRMERPGL